MNLIVLPQALRVIIPPLISQFLNLTKNTSLGIAVSYLDLRGTLGGITLNQTGRELECMLLDDADLSDHQPADLVADEHLQQRRQAEGALRWTAPSSAPRCCPRKSRRHREPGPVKWLHENLLSDRLNTILTVLGIAAVVWLIWTALPWWSHSVWDAEFAGRMPRDRRGRDGRHRRRLLGRDPGLVASVSSSASTRHDLYWRPVLTLGLLFAALAPVLYWGLRSGAWLIAGTASSC